MIGLARRFALISAAAVGAGLAIGGVLVRNIIATGDEFEKMARRTGVSVESLSALSFAAQQSGASIEDIETGIKQFSRQLTNAGRGMGEAQRAFRTLGISWRDLEGLNPEQQIIAVARAMARIENPALRATIAQELFGDSGTRLLPFLEEGPDGIARLTEQSRILGITWSGRTSRAAAEFTDRINTIRNRIIGAATAIVQQFLPELNRLADRLDEELELFIRLNLPAFQIELDNFFRSEQDRLSSSDRLLLLRLGVDPDSLNDVSQFEVLIEDIKKGWKFVWDTIKGDKDNIAQVTNALTNLITVGAQAAAQKIGSLDTLTELIKAIVAGIAEGLSRQDGETIAEHLERLLTTAVIAAGVLLRSRKGVFGLIAFLLAEELAAAIVNVTGTEGKELLGIKIADLLTAGMQAALLYWPLQSIGINKALAAAISIGIAAELNTEDNTEVLGLSVGEMLVAAIIGIQVVRFVALTPIGKRIIAAIAGRIALAGTAGVSVALGAKLAAAIGAIATGALWAGLLLVLTGIVTSIFLSLTYLFGLQSRYRDIGDLVAGGFKHGFGAVAEDLRIIATNVGISIGNGIIGGLFGVINDGIALLETILNALILRWNDTTPGTLADLSQVNFPRLDETPFGEHIPLPYRGNDIVRVNPTPVLLRNPDGTFRNPHTGQIVAPGNYNPQTGVANVPLNEVPNTGLYYSHSQGGITAGRDGPVVINIAGSVLTEQELLNKIDLYFEEQRRITGGIQ